MFYTDAKISELNSRLDKLTMRVETVELLVDSDSINVKIRALNSRFEYLSQRVDAIESARPNKADSKQIKVGDKVTWQYGKGEVIALYEQSAWVKMTDRDSRFVTCVTRAIDGLAVEKA